MSNHLFILLVIHIRLPSGSAGRESACNTGDLGSIPGLGQSPGEGNGYPLQYSGLESPTDFMKSTQRVGHGSVTLTFTSPSAKLWRRHQSCKLAERKSHTSSVIKAHTLAQRATKIYRKSMKNGTCKEKWKIENQIRCTIRNKAKYLISRKKKKEKKNQFQEKLRHKFYVKMPPVPQ